MMNTDIMRELVAEAELGDKSMPTASAAAALWGYDHTSLRDLRYSANAIYIFRQADTPWFLRLSWSGDHSRAKIDAELDFLAYLAEQHYPVVQPVTSLQGNRVETVTNRYATFYAVTFNAAKGSHLPIQKLADDQIQAWGTLLARLHQLSIAYKMPEETLPTSWSELHNKYTSWVPGTAGHTLRYLGEAKQWLAHLPVTQMDYGFCHWDFEPDNLTWHETGIEVIDFDDAAYFWFMADIAFAMDDVLDEPPSRASHIIKHFLDGYQSVRRVDRAWISKLPLFVRLMRVQKAARVHHAYAGTHPELDPPWLSDLRKHHARDVEMLENQFQKPFLAPMTSEETAIWGEVL